jgi:hypothetical protein
MKKLYFCFFIVIVLLNSFSCLAQNLPDTNRIFRIETIYGDIFTGILVSETQSDLVLITENIGEISIPIEHIKSRKEIKPSKNFDPREKYRNGAISEKELLYQKLDKAKRLQVTGTFLTIGGSAAITGGYFLMEKGFMVNSRSTPGNLSGDTYTTTGGAIGLLLMIVGIPTVFVGVTTLIGGTVKRGIVKKKLEISFVNIKNPMSSRSINGVSFRLNF